MSSSEIVTANRFVNIFVIPRRPLIDELSALHSEIEQETSGWVQSKVAEQVVARRATLFHENWLASYPGSRELRRLIDVEKSLLYEEGSVNRATPIVKGGAYRQLSLRVRAEMEILAGEESEHRRQYRDALAPLKDKQREKDTQVFANWQQFMLESPAHPGDFLNFLTDTDFTQLRDESRPLLEALERQRVEEIKHHKIDPFEMVKRLTIDGLTNDLPEDVFKDFIKKLLAPTNAKRDKSPTVQWVEAVSQSGLEYDPNRLLQLIKQSGIFPADLRRLYTEFANKWMEPLFSGISQNVGKYRPVTPLQVPLDLRYLSSKRSNGATIDTKLKDLPANGNNKEGVGPKPEYKIVLGGDLNTSDEQLSYYIEKTAQRFAPNDKRMKTDIRTIIEALRDDPYGFGAGKLHDAAINSPYADVRQGRRLPLWHFSVKRIPGLVLQHPEAERLRIIYYFERLLDPQAVILDSILHHSDFDLKYAGGH